MGSILLFCRFNSRTDCICLLLLFFNHMGYGNLLHLCYFLCGIWTFFFIQYPQTFIQIEKAIEYEPVVTPDVLRTDNRQYNWKDLREQIINQKYYLKSGVNIEELAQQLQVGRTTLSGFINTEEGVNFNLWINKLRVDEAKQLLARESNYSIAQISEMVGFSEQSNFSRQFKLITNESPSTWRQENQVTY